jgi:hypothetical protein
VNIFRSTTDDGSPVTIGICLFPCMPVELTHLLPAMSQTLPIRCRYRSSRCQKVQGHPRPEMEPLRLASPQPESLLPSVSRSHGTQRHSVYQVSLPLPCLASHGFAWWLFLSSPNLQWRSSNVKNIHIMIPSVFGTNIEQSFIKNGVFWDVTPCGPCKNRRFGGTQRLLHQGDKNRWIRNNANCN